MSQNVALFVDGQYSEKVKMELASGKKARIDFKKLRELIESKLESSITEARYFTSILDGAGHYHKKFLGYIRSYDGANMRPHIYGTKSRYLTWRNGEDVIHPETGERFKLTVQKGVDVGICFQLMKSYPRWDKLVLFMGDGDLKDPIEYIVEDQGVSLYIVGKRGTISNDLAQFAEDIWYLEDDPWNQIIKTEPPHHEKSIAVEQPTEYDFRNPDKTEYEFGIIGKMIISTIEKMVANTKNG